MNCKSMFFIIKTIATVSISALMFSCIARNPCPDKPAIGNTGSMLNTGYSDELPVVFENTLYFNTIRKEIDNKESIFESAIDNGEFSAPIVDNTLPINKFPKSTSPSFYRNSTTGIKELYFAATIPNSKAQDRGIFYSTFVNNKWEIPTLLGNNINTQYYESHPAISPDGAFLLFSSDRPGGLGETDLYITWRQNDNTWSEPENLGPNINTSQAEISPCITANSDLYFASKGYIPDSKFDIIKASSAGKGRWESGKPLPFPINTIWDDYGPAVWEKFLIISSNRRGGCGGTDIYKFDLCGPVFLEGFVSAGESSFPITGVIELYDKDENIILHQNVGEDGFFHIPLKTMESYILKYKNSCLADYVAEERFFAPCSDTSTIKLVVRFELPKTFDQFTFEKYKVPFFVTGYYIPNTVENLQALRMKFTYNLLGMADSTKYIEKPGKEYDDYAKTVGQALDAAAKFIITKLQLISGDCSLKTEKIKIIITGYTDPRPLAEASKYDGPTIEDNQLNFNVKRGAQMDNQLLSSLRAYYTAKNIQKLLEKNPSYQKFAGKIGWEVLGKGVDPRENISNELKRRVDIRIGAE